MPLPIVHLAIAVALHDGAEPSADFLLGSLAPDAIHMRPNTSRPDKDRTHLLEKPQAETDPRDYYRAVSAWMDAYCLVHPNQRELATGYASHLLADWLWFREIFLPFCDRHGEVAESTTRAQVYYREADQLDLWLFERMPCATRCGRN
ncbi:MAG: hypothetical protein HC802_06430 [Caldilineaceae bacterium]|nr:hypothetical protein [Caldilineaceae bacterium]